tara:strand:+ start:594 stop:1724 length:1131 start_codon:yes stop_codon:yes gene_type:complete
VGTNGLKLAIFTPFKKHPVQSGLKFLVIQQKMIGDVLTSTVICENLKQHFPNCRIDFIANENTLAVLQHNPYIDEIILFKNQYRKQKSAFFKFLKEIKKERYHAVIDAYGKLESNLISLFARAEFKIALKKWYSSWIYTHTIKENLTPNGNIPLAIENRLQLLNPILGSKNTYFTHPRIFLTATEIDGALKKLETVKTDPAQKLIMIGILGSSPLKTYPAAYMAELLDSICENSKAILLFNYIPSQQNDARAIYEKCSIKTKERIIFDFYANSLRDFIALLSQCDALIGNEGGAVNMAKALDVPTFSIFSPFIMKGAWHSEIRKEHAGVHLADYRPELFANLDKKAIKKNIRQLYSAFNPMLFNGLLRPFLKEYCS